MFIMAVFIIDIVKGCFFFWFLRVSIIFIHILQLKMHIAFVFIWTIPIDKSKNRSLVHIQEKFSKKKKTYYIFNEICIREDCYSNTNVEERLWKPDMYFAYNNLKNDSFKENGNKMFIRKRVKISRVHNEDKRAWKTWHTQDRLKAQTKTTHKLPSEFE